MKTYVNEDSLRAFFPTITQYLGSARVDFTFQIQEAFRQTLDALRARGIKIQQVGTPLDLFRPAGSTAVQNLLTSKTITASTMEDYVDGLDGFNRIVLAVETIKLSAGNEAYVFDLQGSQDITVDPATPPVNWASIQKLQAKASGDLSLTFVEEFRFYRLVSTLSGTLPSIKLQASLQDTALDRLVSYKALQMIMSSFARQDGDIWSKRSADLSAAFENGLAAIQIQVDSAEDNIPTEDEKAQAGGIPFLAMKLRDVHRQFVDDIDELARQNGEAALQDIGALVRRLLPLGRKDPSRFLAALEEAEPLLLKGLVSQGSAMKRSALSRGAEFSAIKLLAMEKTKGA